MAQNTFTIPSIEGNSFIGSPVFSRLGAMQNYNYIVLSPHKNVKARDTSAEIQLLDQENMKYKIEPVALAKPEDTTPPDMQTAKGNKTEKKALPQVKVK